MNWSCIKQIPTEKQEWKKKKEKKKQVDITTSIIQYFHVNHITQPYST